MVPGGLPMMLLRGTYEVVRFLPPKFPRSKLVTVVGACNSSVAGGYSAAITNDDLAGCAVEVPT